MLAAPLAAVATLLAPQAAPAASAPVAPPDWTILKPFKMSSSGGATFTLLPDGSILVGGPSALKDVYTLEFETDLTSITGFKLEALADASLPARGPGRSGGGNFVLSEMRISSSLRHALRYKQVSLQNATADFTQAGFAATQAIDGVDNLPANGWAMAGGIGSDHELVVEARKDLAFDAPALVQLELAFNWGQQHSLGRLRFSATPSPRPIRARGAVAQPIAGLQDRINLAIDRGVEWLQAQQLLDGSWQAEIGGYRDGGTALAMYTLVKSGAGKNHPAVLRALEFLRCVPPRETYSIGCELMALGSLDDPTLEPWIKSLVDSLLTFQVLSQKDGFNYGGPGGAADLSNTQYGALGLRAAAMHGARVPPEIWDKIAAQVLRSREEGKEAYGGVGYGYHPDSKPTGSMTAAGAGILAVCDEQLKGRVKGGSYLALARRGAEWLGTHWGVGINPNGDPVWNYYYLYGVERVGSLLKIEEMSGHPWYREGAQWLVKEQAGDGHWANSQGKEQLCTCFALLFLNRATAPASGKSNVTSKLYGRDDPKLAVSVRASGDTPLTLWISSFGEYEQATYEWPKEEGKGLRVRQVDWIATGFRDQQGEVRIASVPGDPTCASDRDRFGAQYSFKLPGNYSVLARVFVLAPPEGGAAPKEAQIESPPLEVHVREALDPELMQYAKDPLRNLFYGQTVTATASSTINDSWKPAFAVDNLQGRGWASKDDDPLPTLTLDLDRPVRATLLLLSRAKVSDDRPSRIKRVAVTLNGKGPPLDIELAPDDQHKTRVRLPIGTIVRKIEIKVTEAAKTDSPLKSVGLAEVELQAEKPGEKQ